MLLEGELMGISTSKDQVVAPTTCAINKSNLETANIETANI
jgi:hypothetical protein